MTRRKRGPGVGSGKEKKRGSKVLAIDQAIDQIVEADEIDERSDPGGRRAKVDGG
jgi:hypothetical protein